MEDRIAANDRYADLNSADMRFLSAVGKRSNPRTITRVGDYLRVGRQTAHYASGSPIHPKPSAGQSAEEMYLPPMDVLQQIEPPMCRDRSDWI